MIKLVGLDFDGVIIRGSNEGYFACYHKSLESVGVTLEPEIERERIIKRWGMGHIEQLELLLKEHPEFVPKAAETWERCLRESAFQRRITLTPGAKESISELSKAHTVVIVSGTRSQVIGELLDTYQIEGVSRIYSSYDVEDSSKRKPHPYLMELAMREAGATPSETVFVGDMANDVEMATAAGATPIVALTGFLNETEARKLGVKHIIPSLAELPILLRELP